MDIERLGKKTKSGRKHGLINILANSVKPDLESKITKKEEYTKRKKRDLTLMKARYINYISEDEILEVPYLDYAGEPLTQWRFIHNQVYEVPRGLVNKINTAHTNAKKRSQILDLDGVQLQQDKPAKMVHEFVGVLD